MDNDLELAARKLDPGPDERTGLLDRVTAFAENYLDAIPSMKAFNERADRGAGLLESPIGDDGIGLDATLDLIRDHVTSVGLNPTSGRFLGYIPGGGLYYSALGDFLAAVTNRYSGLFFASPGAVRIENQLIRWMADEVGYPETSAGYLAVGGSVANQSAIVAARDHGGIEGDEIQRSVVYMTVHAHRCLDKALALAGLRRCIVRRIPVDDRYRMKADALDDAIVRDRASGLRPWLIVASAGTVNTGSVDPIDEIGQIAERENLWFHIDAAYGGFFVLCPEGKSILKGLQRSDSIVMDPHKTLFLPYGTGALLMKDRRRLLASHKLGAEYLQDAAGTIDELSPSELSPELTKHFRGLRLWLPLKVLGLAPFRAALSEKIQLARYFHQEIHKVAGFEVGPHPDLSVVTYRYVPDRGDPNAFNQKLVRAIHREGRVFLSTTQLDGKFTLRMAAVCFRTHKSDIDLALHVLKEQVERIKESA